MRCAFSISLFIPISLHAIEDQKPLLKKKKEKRKILQGGRDHKGDDHGFNLEPPLS